MTAVFEDDPPIYAALVDEYERVVLGVDGFIFAERYGWVPQGWEPPELIEIVPLRAPSLWERLKAWAEQW